MDLEEYIDNRHFYKNIPKYSTSLPMPQCDMYYYFKVLTGFEKPLKVDDSGEIYYLYKFLIEFVKIDDDVKKICRDDQINGHKKRFGTSPSQQPEIKVGSVLDYFLTIRNVKRMISQVSNIAKGSVSDERLAILEEMSKITGDDFDTLVRFEMCVDKTFGVRGYIYDHTTSYSFRLVKCPICGGTEFSNPYGRGDCTCKTPSCKRRNIPFPSEVGIVFVCKKCGSGKTVPWYHKETKCLDCGNVFRNKGANKYVKPKPKTKRGPRIVYSDEDIIDIKEKFKV